jgi:replication factor C subunit 2/4
MMAVRAESSTAGAGKAKAAQDSAASAGYELPWYSLGNHTNNRVEKYRPADLDDIVGNVETIERLKVIARDGNMPHIIISVYV